MAMIEAGKVADACEFCGELEVLLVVTDHPKWTKGGVPQTYVVCPNCSNSLITHSLSPTQFLRAKALGGDVRRHLLHDDFYNSDNGVALQPKGTRHVIVGLADDGTPHDDHGMTESEVACALWLAKDTPLPDTRPNSRMVRLHMKAKIAPTSTILTCGDCGEGMPLSEMVRAADTPSVLVCRKCAAP